MTWGWLNTIHPPPKKGWIRRICQKRFSRFNNFLAPSIVFLGGLSGLPHDSRWCIGNVRTKPSISWLFQSKVIFGSIHLVIESPHFVRRWGHWQERAFGGFQWPWIANWQWRTGIHVSSGWLLRETLVVVGGYQGVGHGPEKRYHPQKMNGLILNNKHQPCFVGPLV